MDIAPDGSKIALSCYHKIQIWSLISKKELISIDDNSVNGFGIKYSNDGKKLAVINTSTISTKSKAKSWIGIGPGKHNIEIIPILDSGQSIGIDAYQVARAV
jgi:hypothetical protein